MRKVKSERGAVLLEFVVSSLLLVLVFCSLVNLGIMVRDKIFMTSAAREAARTLAVLSSDPETASYAETKAKRKAEDILGMALQSGESEGISSARISLRKEGNLAVAEIICDEPLFFPGFSLVLGGGRWQDAITLKETAVYQIDSGIFLKETAQPGY